jgi:hypothetical protein
MTTASNSYADKVFAEHPIALWPLDEQTYYVSLIPETQRIISSATGWTVNGATPGLYGGISGEALPLPVFPTSVVNKLTLGASPSSPALVEAVSPILINDVNDIDQTIGNISVGAFFYPFSEIVNIEIGIECTVGGEAKRLTSGYQVDNAEQWAFLSGVFDLPDGFEDLKIVLEFSIANASQNDKVLVHGITIGQWSEQFQVESLGAVPQIIPNTIAVDGYGSAMSTYGLQNASGYYMISKNILRAKNSGLPMVYGADNSTVVTPNVKIVEGSPVTIPSMIIPGYGFLNEDGQYSDLTLEMWLKIQSSAITPKRIVGPVGSDDGLYVNDSFLVLKVGRYNSSYYVGEWDRPMLVQIKLSSAKAGLVINGEEVISMTIDPAEITLPDKYGQNGKDQDWIGFYAYEDVPRLELDCVGIYPYKVPSIMSKRRWIYGQGVESSENISGSNLGTTVSFDYTFAKYAKNYFYPDIGRWNQGIAENIVVDNTTLSLPQYQLPTLNFNNKSNEEWYEDNADLSSTFGTYMSMKPNSEWNSTEGYILFNNLNLLQQDLKAFYGLFESDGTNTSKQTLFLLQNEETSEQIEISIRGAVTSYEYSYLETATGLRVTDEPALYADNFHVPGDFLFVGLDIDKFIRYAGGRVANFLGSKQQIKLYVGGRPDFTQTLSGNIYRIGFCTARNLEKISTVFADTGLPVGYNAVDKANTLNAGNTIFVNDKPAENIFNWDQYYDGGDKYFGNSSSIFEEEVDGGGVYSLLVSYILEHTASYTFLPKIFMGNFILDIAVNSYWQDYLPLSYFAKYVTDGTVTSSKKPNKYLDVDFIQFNIDYPAINKFLANSYDTTNSLVRTYVSFQELSDEPTATASRFAKTILSPKNGAVKPSDGQWQTRTNNHVEYTKYEVVNDTIIYPPRNISFDKLAIVFHIEIISKGIKENPVIIKSLQLASQALNGFIPNPVGTKFGTEVIPYRKSSELYDYKGFNPFSIYKKSSPYFYLTSNSGMRLRGFYDGDIERGIEIPINKNASPFYKASAWQMAIRYDSETFPSGIRPLFEIYSRSGIKESSGDPNYIKNIKFYMSPDDDSFRRARIYAINSATGLEEDGITYYINGRRVHNPVIETNSWAMLGFTFNEPLDFSGKAGYLSFNGPVLFNNVSHYQISEADEASRSIYRKWFSVKTLEGVDENWEYWKTLDGNLDAPGTQTFTWQNVLFISSEEFVGVNGTTIYRKYTGTDRIIVDSENQISIGGYRYGIYKNLSWQTAVITPV